jgi:cell division protein FtsB
VVLLIVAVAAFWIALSLYHGLGTEANLRHQLTQLQGQSQNLEHEVQAQRVELKTASSAAAQAEIARAEGLVPPTDKVYAVENPVQAAGPVAIQQGAEEVGQTASSLVQSLLGLAPPAS